LYINKLIYIICVLTVLILSCGPQASIEEQLVKAIEYGDKANGHNEIVELLVAAGAKE
jgi:hypothetical protein